MFILSKKLTGDTYQLYFHLYILFNKFGHGLCAILFYVQKGPVPQLHIIKPCVTLMARFTPLVTGICKANFQKASVL